MPLPKKPLTHAESCFGVSRFARIAVENALEGVAELPVADEGLELRPQLFPGRLIGSVDDARLPVVGEPRRARVAIEHLVDLHKPGPPPCSVIPWAR